MDICRKYVELHEKIKNINIAMLTVSDEKGRLRSMPMQTLQTECDGSIWFFTDLDSDKVDEIHRNPHVNLSYIDQKKDIYVSVEGTAEIIEDRKKIEQLWKPSMLEMFPGGIGDNLGLLKIMMEHADYWNGKNMTEIWDTTDVLNASNNASGELF